MFFRNPQQAEIDVNSAKELLDNSDVVWLDVREIREYQQLHIPNSKLIPLGLLSLRELELKDAKDKDIIVYCRTGSRSYRATRWLNGRGYRAKNLAGGLVQWNRVNYPTIKGAL